MSKASQRKLAEQQKRQEIRKKKDPGAAAIEELINFSESGKPTDTVRFWTNYCQVHKQGDIHCPDDDFAYLSDHLDAHKFFLESWAMGGVNVGADDPGFTPGPGILRVVSPAKGLLSLPYSPTFISVNFSDKRELVVRLLAAVKQAAPLEANDVVLCSIFAPMDYCVMATLVLSASGTCMSAIYVDGTWIKSKFATPFVAVHHAAHTYVMEDKSWCFGRYMGEKDINQLLSSGEVLGDVSPALLYGLGPQLNWFINRFAAPYLEHSIRLAEGVDYLQEGIEHIEKVKSTELEEGRALARKNQKSLLDQLAAKNEEIVKLKTEVAVLRKKSASAPTTTSTPKLASAQALHAQPRPNVNAKMLSFFDM